MIANDSNISLATSQLEMLYADLLDQCNFCVTGVQKLARCQVFSDTIETPFKLPRIPFFEQGRNEGILYPLDIALPSLRRPKRWKVGRQSMLYEHRREF